MPQYFFSLTEKTSLKPETNLIHYYNRTFTQTCPLPLVHSNVPDVALIDSVACAIAVYIDDEYKLAYLKPLLFSSDKPPFLTIASKLSFTIPSLLPRTFRIRCLHSFCN